MQTDVDVDDVDLCICIMHMHLHDAHARYACTPARTQCITHTHNMEGGSARKEKAENTRGESGAETGNGQAGRHTHRDGDRQRQK